MACHLFGAKPLPESMLPYYQSAGSLGIKVHRISIKIQESLSKKIYIKLSSVQWQPLCLRLNVLTLWSLNTLVWHAAFWNISHQMKISEFLMKLSKKCVVISLIDNTLVLVQVIAFNCPQMRCYLNQCWLTSQIHYHVTWKQWVKSWPHPNFIKCVNN